MPARLVLVALSTALCVTAPLVPAALANVPPPVTKTNPIRMPASGDANGTLSTLLTYTDTTAAASVSTGRTIRLSTGRVFKLSTCVAYHLYGQAPASTCADRTVDTRANRAAVRTYAPAVELTGQPRPSGAAVWGYFTPYVQVVDQTDGTYSLVAHSWPDDGLQGAGLPVAAQDATSAVLAPNQTVTLDGPYNGAINSGQPDSICSDQPIASDGSALPTGVSTSHPAFAGAPAYYEVGLPTGAYEGQAPRGVMLVIHGGGWTITGVGAVQVSRGDAARWRARGLETVNLTYRACGRSFGDAAWFYDKARAWFGATAKICAMGTSAGGHLALLLAATRPDVYCVVSEAGPTDLGTIQTQQAYDPATGRLSQTNRPSWVHNLGAAAFGEENLPSYSPAALAAGTLKRTRVLQGFSTGDPSVPWAQALQLRDAMLAADPAAYVDSDHLALGSVPFVHAGVTQPALDGFHAREDELIAPLTSPTVALDRR